MHFKSFISISALLLLAGCQATQASKHALLDTPSTSLKTNKESMFVYSPSGREQFVFNTKSVGLQKFGYDKFCPDTKSFACYDSRLKYDSYVGLKGYFETKEPSKKGRLGYEFYPVVLENGEKYYFVANKKYGGKYGSSSPIIPLKQYQEVKSFKLEPLIPGSSIQVVSKEISHRFKSYTLSNGKSVSDKDLKLIREVSARFGNKPDMAELLLDMKISKDEVDYRFFISAKGNILRSEARLYIGMNEKDEWLRFKVKYYGDDWLFVKSFKIAADDYRWQSPKMNFERDHASGDVWEWVDVSVNKQYMNVVKALSSSAQSTIRFQGKQYYSDESLADDQKEGIKKILELYAMMKSA